MTLLSLGTNNTYSANVVHYDGSTAYLSSGASINGVTSLIFNIWFKATAQDGASHYIIGGTSSNVLLYFAIQGGTQRFRVDITDGSGTYNFYTTTSFSGGTSNQILMSVDINHASGARNRSVLVNGSIDACTTQTDIGGSAISANLGAFNVGASIGAGNFWGCDTAEVFFKKNPGFVDFSVAGNAAKFRSQNGHPVDLLKSGYSPELYLRGKAASYGTNSGTGGNFTINGSFTDSATVF